MHAIFVFSITAVKLKVNINILACITEICECSTVETPSSPHTGVIVWAFQFFRLYITDAGAGGFTASPQLRVRIPEPVSSNEFNVTEVSLYPNMQLV
jgi:hypothetical protein